MALITIKSFPNGFRIILDDKAPMESLIEEMAQKFKESARFFGKARRAISFEGRKLNDDEEDALIQAITDNCEVEICCILEKDDERNDIYLKAMERFADCSKAARGQVYKGTLKSGQILKSPYNIIVLGDVNRGSSVISGGSIVILGTLYGTAKAGVDEVKDSDFVEINEEEPDNGSCFVVAIEMKPTAIAIGNVLADINNKALRVPILSKKTARIAYEKDGMIMIDALSREFLADLPF